VPGLVYLKFYLHGKNLKPFDYEGYKLHNIVDIYALRKRLYTMKDIEKVDFEALLGNAFSEFRFGGDSDIDFHSNFDSGNLHKVIKGEDGIYYLEMMPDTNSTGHFKWFYFSTSHMAKGQCCTFRVFNFRSGRLQIGKVYYKSKRIEKRKGIGWKPVASSCRYFSNDSELESFDPRVRGLVAGMHSVEFSFQFESDDDQVSFALMPAYTYEDLQVDSYLWSHSVKNAPNL
jgi:Cytosolic carboxypeptidase N-terminal domain